MDLQDRCERLRSLHTPGDPLLLPNVWDVATARAVVAADFPVVATTSAGVAIVASWTPIQMTPAHPISATSAAASSVRVSLRSGEVIAGHPTVLEAPFVPTGRGRTRC